MIILGIESSCDETALSLLRLDESRKPTILSELISSQIVLHQEYGGVVPELAAREHLKNLPLLYTQILESSGVSLHAIDAIAVTTGPGLKGCLLMGLGFAKGLSLSSGKPLIGVNHIEGHVLSPFLTTSIQFPYLCLVVSGGHTELVIVKNIGEYHIIARTTDDAAGEAFDKSAALLGIPYPGGAQLSRLADSVSGSDFVLPKVMREAKGFSFSGLKTAINLLVKKTPLKGEDDPTRASLAWAIQESIVDALWYKVKKALEETKLTSLAIVGGVAANRRLKEVLGNIKGITVFTPTSQHCTDNATMIAYAGALRVARGEMSAHTISVTPRWPIEELS